MGSGYHEREQLSTRRLGRSLAADWIHMRIGAHLRKLGLAVATTAGARKMLAGRPAARGGRRIRSSREGEWRYSLGLGDLLPQDDYARKDSEANALTSARSRWAFSTKRDL